MTESRRILVVDDQSEILDLARMVLADAGYSVATATGGLEALSVARGRRFDLALLDINMPGVDGWETLKLFKADEELCGIPVVMFSVKAEVRDRVYGLQRGALDYITKPFGVEELVHRVRRILTTLDEGGGKNSSASGAR